MLRRLFFFVVLFQRFTASADELHFEHLNSDKGLSSNNVTCTFTDSRGFNWIGTSEGLNLFNGETFTVFHHSRSDSASIPHDQVFTICEGKDGMIWAGTENGICRINPWNRKAETINQHNDGTAQPMRVNNHAYCDKEGNVWGYSQDGLWKFDEAKNEFINVICSTQKSAHPEGLSTVYEDNNHHFWIGTWKGLALFNIKTNEYHLFPDNDNGDQELLITAIYQDKKGALWCGSWADGVGRFEMSTGKYLFYKWSAHPANASTENIVFSFAETEHAGHTQLWMTTNIALVQLTEGSFPSAANTTFIHADSTQRSGYFGSLGALSTGDDGQLWLGTSEGVFVLLPTNQAFHINEHTFSGQTLRIVNDDSLKFVCTWYGNGLQLLNRNNDVVREWKRVPENSGDLDCGQVSDVVHARDGKLWVATFGGLAVSNDNGNSFRQVLHTINDPNSICSNHITCITEGENGFLWAGSYNNGLSIINPENLNCVNISANTPVANSLGDEMVWALFRTSKGNIWAGTNDGITIFPENSPNGKTIRKIQAGKDSVALGIISSIAEDQNGNIWFGGDDGLWMMDANGVFTNYTREEGLPDNDIISIHADSTGNMWIATSNGLSQFDPSKKEFTNYSTGSGLPTAALNGDLTMERNGHMIIALNGKLITFDPDDLVQPDRKPSVYFTSINIAGKDFNYNSPAALDLPLELKWNDNLISLDFVSPGFRGDPNVNYAYHLVGSDTTWTLSGKRHFVTFSGLPAGDYVFECKASIAPGVWSDVSRFSFTIQPVFWKTWWFITTISLFILATVVMIMRRETKRKLKEQALKLEKIQAIQSERNRISRDMHDDLGSGLTKIAIMSEVVKKKLAQPDEAKKQIDSISDSARGLVDNLNEIIWALNPENDNLNNLAAYIREYADRYLESSDIRLICDIPESLEHIELSEEKRRFLFLVIKESLHNIVKHAQATEVQIKFVAAKDVFTIHISDNGKGFEISEARPLGNGLKNMKKRMENIGAEFSIESSPGNGTATTILFTPDNK